jgi:hypothetical protein
VTELLKEAVARLLALAEEDQSAMATRIIAEIEAESHWQQAFARRPEVLKELAEEALDEFRRGETEDLDDLLK